MPIVALVAMVLALAPGAVAQESDGDQADEPCVGPQEITARTDGPDVVVAWSAFPGADSYNLYRSEILQSGPAGGGFDVLVNVDGDTTQFRDDTAIDGKTYRYFVTAVVADEETDPCDIVEVTAVPTLPTIMAGALASMVGVTAYAALRRRS